MKIRKHVSQMSKSEKGYLINRINKLDKSELVIPEYAMGRIKERFLPKGIIITDRELRKILGTYSLIEYSVKQSGDLKDERVTLLSRAIYTGKHKLKYKVYVVYSITNNAIVTAFINNANDNHESLNMDIYTKDYMIT